MQSLSLNNAATVSKLPNAATAMVAFTLARHAGLDPETLWPRPGLEWPDNDAQQHGRIAAHVMAAEQSCKLAGRSFLDLTREVMKLKKMDPAAFLNSADTARAALDIHDMVAGINAAVEGIFVHYYEKAEDPTRGWVAERDVLNFQEAFGVEVDPVDLDLLPHGGTATDLVVLGDYQGAKVARFAKQIYVTEEDFIDDRIELLLEPPRMLAQAAARCRINLVFAALLKNDEMRDGTALFHGDHGNLGSGGGSALGETALGAALAALAAQSLNDHTLAIKGRHLVVPSDLRVAAMKLARALNIGNPDEDFIVHSDARLSQGVTDPRDKTKLAGSAAAWYLLADPVEAPAIELLYRAGTNRSPVIRRTVLEAGRWGMGWDVAFDLGVRLVDYRPIYKGEGA